MSPDTVTVTQPPVVSTTKFDFTSDGTMSLHLGDDLNIMLQLLQNEFYEDQEENCKTGKLTDRQKTLVPLIAQVSSAYSLEDKLHEFEWIMTGIAKALKAEKVYWDI
jgi:hypothetical protein